MCASVLQCANKTQTANGSHALHDSVALLYSRSTMPNSGSWLGEGDVLPRYLFLEPLLVGKRVLEIGAVSLAAGVGARFLKERAAEYVASLDSDKAAVR